MEHEIVNSNGLAKALVMSPNTLKKTWRSLPHFFVGEGRNLKGARFIVNDVIEHLKKEANYDCVERSEKGSMDSQVSVSEQTVQKGGIPKARGCSAVGGGQEKRAEKSAGTRTGADPFNLLSGIDGIS